MEWFLIILFVVISPFILIVSLTLALSLSLIFRSLGNGAKNEVARKRYEKLRVFFMVVFIVVLSLVIVLVALALIINPELDQAPVTAQSVQTLSS